MNYLSKPRNYYSKLIIKNIRNLSLIIIRMLSHLFSSVKNKKRLKHDLFVNVVSSPPQKRKNPINIVHQNNMLTMRTK